MAPHKPWKTHEDRLYDVCFFCRLKSSRRNISEEFKAYIKENLLPEFDNLESILPKGSCDRCRLILYDIIKNVDSSKVLPPNDYQEMVQLLRNLPASTRSSNCVCFCCEMSKSPNHKAKPGRPSTGNVKKKQPYNLPEPRPERVKKLFADLSPRTREALALQTIEDLKSQNPTSNPVHLRHATGGTSVPILSGKKAVEKATKSPQLSHTAVREIQSSSGEVSNQQMGKFLKNVRNSFGRNSVEAGAEKALISDSKLVKDFFTTERFNFKVTDPDDKKNTIVVSKSAVFCNDVTNLTNFVDEKRGFSCKKPIKLQADGGRNTMKVTANFQKPINIPEPQETVEDSSDNDQNVKNVDQSDIPRKSARLSSSLNENKRLKIYVSLTQFYTHVSNSFENDFL